MIKRLFIIFLMSFGISQSDELESTLLGSFGSVTINDNVYNQFSLKPEFSIGKLGMGFDIYFYLDEDGSLYEENWNFSSTENSLKTLVDKIYYLRWGQPLDNLYFRIGALPDITLGHGILVKDYSNVIDYPHVRRTGFDFRYKFSEFNLSIIHSDLKELDAPGLLAIRTDFDYVDNLNLGITLVSDINQKEGLIDSDNDDVPDYLDEYPNDDNYWNINQTHIEAIQSIIALCVDPDNCDYNNDGILDNIAQFESLLAYWESQIPNYDLNRDQVSAISIDMTYQINENINIYSEFAQLIGETRNPYNQINNPNEFNSYDANLGYGIIPFGMYGNFGPVQFTMDLRYSSERFIFNYWNQNYDHNRVMISTNNELQTKENTLYNFGKLKGANIGMVANIANYVNFSFSYQYLYGEKWGFDEATATNRYIDENNSSLLSKIDIDTSKLPKVRIAELFYQQTNVENPFDFKPNQNTLIGYNVGIDMADNMVFILKGRKTYVPNNLGEYNSVKTTQIETQILF